MKDKEISALIKQEEKRQSETIDLIASENFVSPDVREALGSVFTNKYSEGYPHSRYYAGNENVDKVEELAQSRALKLFKLSKKDWSVNVQPYSGSPANLAILLGLIPIGEKIMGMSLNMGGHLTHGHPVSATGKLWNQVPYGVDRITGEIDYGELLNIALIERPKCIIGGGTAYSRIVSWKKLRTVADEVGAILCADMSHFSGLVAGGVYPSPFQYADVVMTTMHKTLRGPRAGIIFSKSDLSVNINKAVFPGLQGGPHINQIAAIAVALKEAMEPSFKKYTEQVVKNAKSLSEELEKFGFRIISGGTDTHLFLVDTMALGASGKTASEKLEKIGIITNKNAIPFDERKPADPSGIRIGTPSVTTRGMKEKEMKQIADIIMCAILHKNTISALSDRVKKLTAKFKVKL